MAEGLVIIAIDIEARGQGPKTHGIMSIGVCIGRSDREEVVAKHRFDLLPLAGQVMEQRCYDEFWSKHHALHYGLTRDAAPASTQVADFRALIDAFPSAYIVCDNPGFDFGMINYYLDVCGHPTLNYVKKPNGQLEYRNNHDCDSYARGWLRSGFTDQWLSNKTLAATIGSTLDMEMHNHLPENDAELVYRLHFQTVVSKALA